MPPYHCDTVPPSGQLRTRTDLSGSKKGSFHLSQESIQPDETAMREDQCVHLFTKKKHSLALFKPILLYDVFVELSSERRECLYCKNYFANLNSF